MKIPQAIQAILFATAEPQTFAFLAKQFGTDTDTIKNAVGELKQMMEGHGIAVVELNDVVSLVTESEFSSLIEAIRKDELSKELSKASAETLAIVAYVPGIAKSQIEFIRGVNVSYSLRALMMRGLIEQKGAGRGIGYYPTLSVLEHFGVTKIEDLPDYTQTKTTLDTLLARQETAESTS
jgi:segregation and condensation protein B